MSQPEHDDLTTQLTRSLTDRADTMSGSSLGLAEVTRRARSIRRRRTATAVVGAAAVVAVLVPTAALARHSGGSAPDPVSRPTTSTQTAQTIDAGAFLDVSELPAGAPPRLGYEVDGTYHQPNGSTLAAGTDSPVDRMAALVDGTIVYQTRDGSGQTAEQTYSPDAPGLKLSVPELTGEGFAVNAARNLVAWMTTDGRVGGYAVDGTDFGTFRLQGKVSGDSAQVLAVAGQDCGSSGPCRVLVRSSDPRSGENLYWVVTPGGGAEQLTDADFRSWSDLTTDGTRVGLTRVRDDGSTCSGIAAAGRPPAFRTCDHQLVSFSPSGDDVSAIADQTDGAGSSDLAAYDVGGQLLFDHASDPSKPARQATVQTLVWEDDTHLLATVYQQGEWSVVRFGLDGSMEVAVPGVAGDIASSPIVLPGERS